MDHNSKCNIQEIAVVNPLGVYTLEGGYYTDCYGVSQSSHNPNVCWSQQVNCRERKKGKEEGERGRTTEGGRERGRDEKVYERVVATKITVKS